SRHAGEWRRSRRQPTTGGRRSGGHPVTVTVVVLDSVGVGALPDARDFGDEGSHTLDNVVRVGDAQLPNLAALGLGNVPGVTALPRTEAALASYGRLVE